MRVAPRDAERARALLERAQLPGEVVRAGAAWFSCHACGKDLTGGELRCPSCDAFVRD